MNNKLLLDIAYGIIDLINENYELRAEVEHLHKMKAIYQDAIDQRDKASSELTGMMLTALFNGDVVSTKEVSDDRDTNQLQHMAERPIQTGRNKRHS